MDRQSTKTREELEHEEAARLVRPAPKYKPPRRDLRRERDDSDQEVDPDEAADRKDRSDNYKDVGGSTGPKERILPLVEAVLARYAISSYPTPSLMTSVSEKAAVYHGVAPYKETPGYVPWTQPHQRDLGDGDYAVLLKAAKDWLKTPVLSVPLVDANRDVQLRAALDLAIFDGPYNGAIQPKVYNLLLAKLAGVDADETLLTQRKATASSEIRKLAAKYAAQDAPLAYELMDLASKVAQAEVRHSFRFSGAVCILNVKGSLYQGRLTKEVNRLLDRIPSTAFTRPSRSLWKHYVDSNGPMDQDAYEITFEVLDEAAVAKALRV